MMEAIRSYETSILIWATRRNIPEGGILHSHRLQNLKSYIILTKCQIPSVVVVVCNGWENSLSSNITWILKEMDQYSSEESSEFIAKYGDGETFSRTLNVMPANALIHWFTVESQRRLPEFTSASSFCVGRFSLSRQEQCHMKPRHLDTFMLKCFSTVVYMCLREQGFAGRHYFTFSIMQGYFESDGAEVYWDVENRCV
jgi:hypothetical protein